MQYLQWILWVGYILFAVYDNWRTRNYRKSIARLEADNEYRRKEVEEMRREIIELKYKIKRA